MTACLLSSDCTAAEWPPVPALPPPPADTETQFVPPAPRQPGGTDCWGQQLGQGAGWATARPGPGPVSKPILRTTDYEYQDQGMNHQVLLELDFGKKYQQ